MKSVGSAVAQFLIGERLLVGRAEERGETHGEHRITMQGEDALLDEVVGAVGPGVVRDVAVDLEALAHAPTASRPSGRPVLSDRS